jgi:hypothetical protein
MGTSDFHMFGRLKKRLADKWSATDVDMKQAVTSLIELLDADFLHAWMQALVLRWDRCLNVNAY